MKFRKGSLDNIEPILEYAREHTQKLVSDGVWDSPIIVEKDPDPFPTFMSAIEEVDFQSGVKVPTIDADHTKKGIYVFRLNEDVDATVESFCENYPQLEKSCIKDVLRSEKPHSNSYALVIAEPSNEDEELGLVSGCLDGGVYREYKSNRNPYLNTFYLALFGGRITLRENCDEVVLHFRPTNSNPAFNLVFHKEHNAWSFDVAGSMQVGAANTWLFESKPEYFLEPVKKIIGRKMKLAKILKAIGVDEQVILNCCTHLKKPSGKVAHEIMFLDKYIPEVYMWLKKNKNLSSCMAYGHDDYSLPEDEHPLLAYEQCPEIRLCLVYDRSKETIAARSIGVPKDKLIFRSYTVGGYDRVFNPFGMRKINYTSEPYEMSYIESAAGSFLLPYIDVNDNCAYLLGGARLVTAEEGDYSGDHETGRPTCFEREGFFVCERCDDLEPEEDARSVLVGRNNTEHWCERCWENHTVSDIVGDLVATELAVELTNGEYTFEDDAVYSEYHNGYILTEDATNVDWVFKDGSSVGDWILSDEVEQAQSELEEEYGILIESDGEVLYDDSEETEEVVA